MNAVRKMAFVEVIDRERLCEIEPHTAGVKAIWVPDTRIVSYRDVALRLAEILAQRGGRVINDAFVRESRRVG